MLSPKQKNMNLSTIQDPQGELSHDRHDHVVLDPAEDVSALEREELEDRYLDLKDEVWRLRRSLLLEPATGKVPSSGGYSGKDGMLRHQRVAVFVDVQNMYHSAKKFFGQNLSYGKLLRAAVGPRKLVRAIAYVIERPDVDQQSFFDLLRYSGFEVRRRELIERFDGSSKADWDLGIAREMVAMADRVDAIVLASGNGVFADMAPLIKAKGVRFECCAFYQAFSEELRRTVDSYRVLGEEHLYSRDLSR